MRPGFRSFALSVVATTLMLSGAIPAEAQVVKTIRTMADEILEHFGLAERVNARMIERARIRKTPATTAHAVEESLTFEDEIINITHGRFYQGANGKELFPKLSEEIVDGFVVGGESGSQLFRGMQVSHLVRTVGEVPTAKVEQAMATFDNNLRDGFVVVGGKGSGKTHVFESIEATFRTRRQTAMQKTVDVTKSPDGIFARIRASYAHRNGAVSGRLAPNGEYVITVNPNNRLYGGAKDEQEFVQALKTLKDSPQFSEASVIVFHFPGLKYYSKNLELREGRKLLDRHVEMFKEIGSPRQRIKFGFEASATDVAFLKETEIGKRLIQIDVAEPASAIEQMTVIRRNMAILDPSGIVQVADSDLSRLTVWATRYAPGEGVAQVGIDAIETAKSRLWSMLKNPLSQDTDEVLGALKKDLVVLQDELEEVRRLTGSAARARVKQLESSRGPIQRLQKEIAEQVERYEKFKSLRRQIDQIRAKSGTLTDAQMKEELNKLFALYRDALTLKERDLALALAEITGKRVSDILRGSGRMTLDELRKALDEAIIGQENIKAVIMRIARAVEQAFLTGKFNANKPIFRAWVSGKPGTGKTAGFKILADFFDQLILINGAEYADNMSKTKLIGSNPGYVNAGEPGTLSGPLQQAPAIRLILVDEAESISESNLELLANGLDPAVGKDGMGNDIDFRRTVMVFTSNAGQDLVDDGSNLSRRDLITAIRMDKPGIPAKLMDRMDEVLWADRITAKNELSQIVRKFVRIINDDATLKSNYIKVLVHPRAVDEMVEEVLREAGSARMLDQATARYVKDPITVAARQASEQMGKPLKQALTTHRYLRSDGVIEGLELRRGDAVLLDFDPVGNKFFYRIIP